MMRDIQIKRTPSGLIIEKEGRRISFEGKSGELIRKLLEQEQKEDFKNSLLKYLISSLGQLPIKESFQQRIKKIKDKRIFLCLSNDNISSNLIKFFHNLNFSGLDEFNIQEGKEKFLEKYKGYSPDYLLVYHNSPEREFLLFLNKFALENKIRFIRAFREQNLFIIAPLVIPYETACYRCYTFLKTNNQIYDYDTLDKDDIKLEEISDLPELISSLCANLFCLKTIQFFGEKIHYINQLQEIVLDLNNLDITYNPVLKVPNCPDCNIGTKV